MIPNSYSDERINGQKILGFKILAFERENFETGEHYCVISPYQHAVWTENSLNAVCLKQTNNWLNEYYTFENHKAPSENCKCGIYATIHEYDALQFICFAESFLCIIEGEGSIFIHEKGWRAEQARIISVVQFTKPVQLSLYTKSIDYITKSASTAADMLRLPLWDYVNAKLQVNKSWSHLLNNL